MSKREEVSMTLGQWQKVLETAIHGRANFPKFWGDQKDGGAPIPIDEQLTGREDLGDLFKALRAYSSWLQGIGEDYKVLFGEKADWHPIDSNGKRIDGVTSDGDVRIKGWRMTDQIKTRTLRLSREAKSGVVWCCILRLHPHCIMPTTTKDAVDYWWPIAEAVGKTSAVRKYIGLASAKRTEWEDDPETDSVDSGPAPEKQRE